jgi:4-diphosphocytidyl-2C-methyl-D-erythritol kinase
VLAKPAAGLSTEEVYRRLYAPRAIAMGKYFLETEEMLQALAMGDLSAISRCLVNDLEKPAFRLLPGLVQGCMRMYEEGCQGVLLCGSGSALFGLCADAATAEHAALALSNDFPWTTTTQFLVPH